MHDSGATSHEVFELPDNVLAGIHEIHQRLNKWEVLEELNIAKEYLNGRLGILIEFDTISRVQVSYQRGSIIWPNAKLAIAQSSDLSIWLCDFNVLNAGQAENGCERPMLIDNIEFMKSKEFFAQPSWMCLESAKEFNRVTSGCFYSITQGFVFSGALTKRKGRFAVLCTFVNPDQFPCGMIEGTSQIVNGISDEEREVFGKALTEFHIESESASVRIRPDSKCTFISIWVSGERVFQIADVLIGPFGLEGSTFKHIGLRNEEKTENQYSQGIIATRIIHERFYCNRQSAAATGLRSADSPIGPPLYSTSTHQVLLAPYAGLATRLSNFATNLHEQYGLMIGRTQSIGTMDQFV